MNRIKMLIRVSLFGLLMAPALQAASAEEGSTGQMSRVKLKPEDLVFCHYTVVMPGSGGNKEELVPGSVPLSGLSRPISAEKVAKRLEASQQIPLTRPTLHGVLNDGVALHTVSLDGGQKVQVDRSGYKYAVLIPYDVVKPQVVGGYQQDVVVFGSVPLKKATILVLNGEANPEVSCENIITLAPEMPIFQGVENYLQSIGKPVIHALPKDSQTLPKAEGEFKEFMGSLSEEEVRQVTGGTITLEMVKTDHPKFKELTKLHLNGGLQRFGMPLFRPSSRELASVNAGPYVPMAEILEFESFPELTWKTHLSSALGNLERNLVNQVFIGWLRDYVFEDELSEKLKQKHQISLLSDDAIKADRTKIKECFEKAEKFISTKPPLLVAGFERWKKDWSIWNAYLIKAELDLRKQGKTFGKQTGKDDNLDDRLRSIRLTIEKDHEKDRAAQAAAALKQ